MADLKDLKQAILEIPKLVELLKRVINVQPATMSAGFAATKPQDGGQAVKNPEQNPYSSELKTLRENFEKKLAWQKEYFEKEIHMLKENFNTQAAALKTSTESQNKMLKEMFDVIGKIANSPTLPSDFKKKDGEPSAKPKNVFEEAKALSQKVFSN